MKFDVIRAWKDEAYRESLSAQQLRTLPINPAGDLELSNTDLQSISAGGSFGLGGFAGSFASNQHFHSLAFTCDETVFSVTVNSSPNFLNPVTTFCENDNGHNGPF